MKPVNLDTEADEELSVAYRWYEQQAPGLGDEMIEVVDEALAQIRLTPTAFALYPRVAGRAGTRPLEATNTLNRVPPACGPPLLAMALALLISGGAVAGPPDAPTPAREGERAGSRLGGTDASVPLGSLDKDVIRAVIHDHREPIRRCYEQGLVRAPALAGKVTIRFHISPSGAVASAEVMGSTVADAQLERCVAAQVTTLVFPKPKGNGEVIVTYPFIFRSNGLPGSGGIAGSAQFLDPVLLEKVGWMAATKKPLSLSPDCLGKKCDVRKEVSTLCAAFDEASRRIDAAATYADAVKPLLNAASSVCCDEVVNTLGAIERAGDAERYTVWCGLADEPPAADAAVSSRCAWAECEALNRFWTKYHQQPARWFP